MRPLIVLALAATLAACGAPMAQPQRPAQTQPAAGAKTAITVAMPYIPNVQFAQYYVAASKGYYAAEGLDVSFDYNFETDVVQRVANGTVQFGMASGDSVLLARSQGLKVKMVATINQQFPTVFFSKKAAGIVAPADLKGKSVGIPGRFGASYTGLRAILYASKLTEQDLNIQEIGFAQVPALTEDKVQVASGYGNNEPVQLQLQGVDVNVIRVADIYPLASDGIIASEKLMAEQPETVRKFVRATLRGMTDAIASPDEAFTISQAQIKELASAPDATKKLQRAVLQATLPYWQSDLTAKSGLGFTDPAKWQATVTFLTDSGSLKTAVRPEDGYSNDYLK